MSETMLMPITNNQEWLDKKKNYLTSTEAPALFGCELKSMPSAFQLYHIKRGMLDGDVQDNNYMMVGRMMEETLDKIVKHEHPDWEISPFAFFAYNNERKSGSSFDRKVRIEGKLYLLEYKTTSFSEYKEKFIEHTNEDIEAPAQYEIQMQNELDHVSDEFEGIVLAVLILDTRQMKYIFRKRNPEMIEGIRAAIKEFWDLQSPPAPDYGKDKTYISQFSPLTVKDKALDAKSNNRVTELAAIYEKSSALIKQEEAAKEAAAAELLHILGDYNFAWTNSHKVTVVSVKESKGTLVTQEMVGTHINQKKPYKYLLVKSTQEKL